MAELVPILRTVRQAKIVGGEFAEKGEFPYQVSLTYHDEFVCGGSILSTLLILTAAHCVKYKRPNRLQITAGEHDRSFKSSSGSEQTRTARYIYMHENYVWETDINDIAIIVLSSPLQYTAHVQNISLPRAKEHFTGYATVTGFGRTKEKGEVSNILKKVKIPIVSHEECKRMYKKVRMNVTEKMMCVGDVGRDACQGDSGGPAVCKRDVANWRQNGTSRVICGVISHGYGCGREGYPGIYTRVSDYIDWIESTKEKIISRGKCQTNHFYCTSGPGCIPRTFLCDLESDCKDGEDEQDCAYVANCRNHQFRCNNGRCIKKEWTCDDMDDCGDRSDEDKCPNISKACLEGEHQCDTGGRCIPNDWKCDNEQDCDDNSDELGCENQDKENEVETTDLKTTTTTQSPCREDQFYCSRDYRCIPLRWRCDKDRDCRSGADEIGCSSENEELMTSTTKRPLTTEKISTEASIPTTPKTMLTASPNGSETVNASVESSTETLELTTTSNDLTTTNSTNANPCSRQQFLCDNGECISNVFQCDFEDDCGDGSDERDCHLMEPTCSQYFWKCDNGQCIYNKFRCDDDIDCVDGSDERGCEDNDDFSLSNMLWLAKSRGRHRR